MPCRLLLAGFGRRLGLLVRQFKHGIVLSDITQNTKVNNMAGKFFSTLRDLRAGATPWGATQVGEKFGFITVLAYQAGSRKSGRKPEFEVRCECGAVVIVEVSNVKSGQTKSCGKCAIHSHMRSVNSATHRLCGTPEWRSWSMMLDRCRNTRSESYSNYGGRGIIVCERWLKFENFLADMGKRPVGTTLDRYPNNDGNYEPGNSRWATRVEQANNTRRNRMIQYAGRSLSLADWSRDLCVTYKTLQQRLDRNPNVDAVFARLIAQQESHS
jgi:hypothetical protein